MEKTIYAKLLAVQDELKPIEKSEFNPFFKSNYFDVNAILAQLKPILTKHGLVLVQPLQENQGKNTLLTIVTDSESGEKVGSSVVLPDNLDPQKMGSAITYFRRYSLQSLFALEAADDDAEGVVRPKYDYSNTKDLTPDQAGYKPKKDPKSKDVAMDDVTHDVSQDLNL